MSSLDLIECLVVYLFVLFLASMTRALYTQGFKRIERYILAVAILIIAVSMLAAVSNVAASAVRFCLIRQFWGKILHDIYFLIATTNANASALPQWLDWFGIAIPMGCIDPVGAISESYVDRLSVERYHFNRRCVGALNGGTARENVSGVHSCSNILYS